MFSGRWVAFGGELADGEAPPVRSKSFLGTSRLSLKKLLIFV